MNCWIQVILEVATNNREVIFMSLNRVDDIFISMFVDRRVVE